jgi:DNA-directed RNA polymerase specialized sigma24 family protein
MTDRIPELESDLEWMLQSGQVDLHILAEALVEAWFERVYRLAAAFYQDTDDAIYATIETFNSLLLEIHLYKGESGVTIWICRTILKVFERVQKEKRFHKRILLSRDKSQAFEHISHPSSYLAEPQARMVNKVLDTLNREDRLLTLFRYLLTISLDELAIIYKSDVKTIQLRLQIGRSRLRREIESSVFAADSLKTGFLDKFFELVLQKLWFSSPVEPDFLKQAHAEIVFQVNNRKQSRSKKFSYQEFGWIGGVALVVILLILGVGNIIPKSGPNSFPPQNPSSRIPLSSQENQSDKNSPMDKATPESLPKAYLHYIVLPDDSIQTVASRLGISVQDLRNANNIPADGTILPGQILVIQSGREASAGNQQEFNLVKTPFPLDISNSYPVIAQRMTDTKQFYQSFWGEIHVFYYGPAGYIGPPRGYRVQIWYAAPGNYLLVGGRIQGKPDSIILVRKPPSQPEEVYISYRSDQDGHWFYQNVAELNQLDSVFRLNYSFDALDQVLKILRFQPTKSLIEPSSKENIAGQEAIVATLTDSSDRSRSRIWVDVNTGLILRKQIVSDRENSLVEIEASFIDILYNQQFAAGLFEPYNYLPAEFGNDPKGWPGGMSLGGDAPALWMPPAHPPLSYPPAPEDLDVSKSWLIFQYPASYEYHSSRSLVELFSDNYFLGVVRFGNPWTMICDRSPDGDKIAFVGMPDGPVQGTILNWFSLSDPRLEVKDVLGDINIKEIVFSPNSNQLAVFGKYGSSGGVYIIETSSHLVRRLRQLANASSLVWSPDNEYLAMIARQSEEDDYELFLVLRVSDGEIVYSSMWGQDISSLLPDAPVFSWGVEFPSQPQGLDGCAQPQEESR